MAVAPFVGIFLKAYPSIAMMKRFYAISTTYWVTQISFVSFIACADAHVADSSETLASKPTIPSAPLAAEAITPHVSGLSDTGIFPDLDSKILLPIFRGARNSDTSIAVNLQKSTLTLLAKGVPIKTYPVFSGRSRHNGETSRQDKTYVVSEIKGALRDDIGTARLRLASPKGEAIVEIGGPGGCAEKWVECIEMREADIIEVCGAVRAGAEAAIATSSPSGLRDTDGDGIPDQVDILLGAMKADLNNAAYDDGYYPIAKKNGDVPRDRGCCTDVVIRALRNAGIDLQSAIQSDFRKSPQLYPFIRKPNAAIDHRRVRNLAVYFSRHFEMPDAKARQFLPGDILLFDTLPKKGPDHIGIVSAETASNGEVLIINNWTYGAVTDAMPLLSFVPVTHQFRVPSVSR